MVEISKYGSGEGRPRAIGGAYSTGDDEPSRTDVGTGALDPRLRGDDVNLFIKSIR